MADTATACAASQHSRITPVQAAEGWARARGVKKAAGGDRPVLGGPWKSKPAARTAADASCDRRQAW